MLELDKNTKFLESLIGSSEDQAKLNCKSLNYLYRITQRDGKNYIVTRDYNSSRVNLQIKDNKIIKATIG